MSGCGSLEQGETAPPAKKPPGFAIADSFGNGFGIKTALIDTSWLLEAGLKIQPAWLEDAEELDVLGTAMLPFVVLEDLRKGE